jgi:hypothetical protein
MISCMGHSGFCKRKYTRGIYFERTSSIRKPSEHLNPKANTELQNDENHTKYRAITSTTNPELSVIARCNTAQERIHISGSIKVNREIKLNEFEIKAKDKSRLFHSVLDDRKFSAYNSGTTRQLIGGGIVGSVFFFIAAVCLVAGMFCLGEAIVENAILYYTDALACFAIFFLFIKLGKRLGGSTTFLYVLAGIMLLGATISWLIYFLAGGGPLFLFFALAYTGEFLAFFLVAKMAEK